jgi:hypothetical protein
VSPADRKAFRCAWREQFHLCDDEARDAYKLALRDWQEVGCPRPIGAYIAVRAYIWSGFGRVAGPWAEDN